MSCEAPGTAANATQATAAAARSPILSSSSDHSPRPGLFFSALIAGSIRFSSAFLAVCGCSHDADECVELPAPAQPALRLPAGVAHGAAELGGASPGRGGARKVGRVERGGGRRGNGGSERRGAGSRARPLSVAAPGQPGRVTNNGTATGEIVHRSILSLSLSLAHALLITTLEHVLAYLASVGQASARIIASLPGTLFTSVLTHRLVLLHIDAHCFIFWDLPGDVLAAPESALWLNRCNTFLSLSLCLCLLFASVGQASARIIASLT